MTRQFSSTLRGAFALAVALVFALAAALWAPPARAAGVEIADAEFRWALNKQSSGPSHGPGLNFLSAGDISGAITGPNTVIAPSDWKATAGDITIEKRAANGSSAPATWDGVLTDQSGAALSASSSRYSGLEMVFTGGEGTVDPAGKTAEIEWDGTVSVLYYSGFVYLTISDPVLTVTPSRAVVTATLGGHRSDRADASEWTRMTPKKVTLATLDRDEVGLSDETGFSSQPEYRGVSYPRADSSTPQVKTGSDWGAFPESFLDFAKESGSGGFWYSTGGSSDATKVPSPIVVSWDSDNPHSASGPGSGGSGGSGDPGGSNGIIGEVLQDTVEDIIRAAGTDVAGTAEAWMDEAWKPLQPDAVKAAQAGIPAAAGDSGDSGVLVEEEFAAQYEEYYDAGVPMTAGTVGATLATITIPASGSAPAAPAAPATPASSPAAPQAAAPVASNLPLTEVAYAQTSGSSETGNPAAQWQWWVGGALLALAAGLFYQTVRRKD